MHLPKNNLYNYLLILLICISSNIFSQPNVLTPDVEKDILKGLDATFKFDFKKSDKIFDRLITSYPGAAFGYHYKSIQYLWKFLDNKNNSDLVKFFMLSDSVINRAYNVLSAEKQDAFTYYILGSTYSFRTMAFARQERYMDVVFSAKESKANLDAAIYLDSTFYDAYMGTGLFNFMIAQTPPALKWAMHISGITGDKVIGLKYLKLAAERGNYSKVESQFYLSQILSEFYGEYKESEKILKNLLAKYPKNLLFNYSMASLYVSQSRLAEADKILNKIKTIKDTSFNQLIRYSKLLSGDILYYKNDFKTAIPYYETFIKDSSETHFRGITAFRLGLCYSFLNDTLNAHKYFEMCDEGNTDIDDDRFAKYMGSIFVKNYPDSIRLKLYFIKNLISSGSYKKALDLLLSFPKTNISKSLLAELNLYLSDVSFRLKAFTDSYGYAMSAARNKSAKSWVCPFAYYYAARASLELNYKEDIRTFISKAREYSDYPYKNKLSNLLNVLEYKLEQLKETNVQR
jgi:hypothetical protein